MSDCARYRRLFFILALVAGSGIANAQEQWEKEREGEIKDVEIEITKERVLTLPRASRNFEKVPPRPFEPIMPAIRYDFKPLRFAAPEYTPAVRPLRLKQEELPALTGIYASGGIGNFSSLLFHGSATTKRNEKGLLGADFYWRKYGSGPVGGDNSASSTTRMMIFGKATGKVLTAGGEAAYERQGTYFYGYDPSLEVDRDRIKQTYGKTRLRATLEKTKREDFNYLLGVGYSRLHDRYHATEDEFSLDVSSDIKVDEKRKILLKGDFFSIIRSDSLVPQSSRTLLRLKPSVVFSVQEKWKITAGLNFALQNDAPAGTPGFHTYPHVLVDYLLDKSWVAFANLTGDMDKVNLHTTTAENLWLAPNITLNHTNRSLDFSAGVRGKVNRSITMTGGFAFATLKNYYFYQSLRDDLDPNGIAIGFLFDKFEMVYDPEVQRFNPFLELRISHREKMNINIRGDYYSYSTLFLPALHRPTYRVDFGLHYNMFNKIALEGGLILQGGMKAQDPVTGVVGTLDAAADLRIHTTYFVSNRVSVFLRFDNILSNQYPLFLSYPARGFQVLGGASWTF